MKIAFGLEYCGTQYYGWQRQQNTRTVQECVEKALSKVADQQLTVYCAGRTDTGVHALHQIIHSELNAVREMHSWVFGGNANLPYDISILWAQEVASDFHARFSAIGRTYRYIILNRPARSGLYHDRMTWECRSLDEYRMQQAADCLVGKHDFTSYRAIDCQAKTPVRTIRRLEVHRQGDYVVIEIEADAFLHHMVRNIAGVLMEIGMNKAPVDWAEQVLKAHDRTLGGVTAPPEGLYLINVNYPEKFAIPERNGSTWSFII